MSEFIKLSNEYFKSKDKSLIPKIARAKAMESAKKAAKEIAKKKIAIKKIEEIAEKKAKEMADVNKDGVVDEKDLSIVHKEYSKEVKDKKKKKKSLFKD